jgi:hypothetical protein
LAKESQSAEREREAIGAGHQTTIVALREKRGPTAARTAIVVPLSPCCGRPIEVSFDPRLQPFGTEQIERQAAGACLCGTEPILEMALRSR